MGVAMRACGQATHGRDHGARGACSCAHLLVDGMVALVLLAHVRAHDIEEPEARPLVYSKPKPNNDFPSLSQDPKSGVEASV